MTSYQTNPEIANQSISSNDLSEEAIAINYVELIGDRHVQNRRKAMVNKTQEGYLWKRHEKLRQFVQLTGMTDE